ncbi:hypothetical protein HYH03_002675 [Edaphochlamys debaryana]|uniref:K Homology domain-containing protein n=1 Tax=Edaphochlamys debaryana TaxID=47281 RepID=A0A835YBA1_9CHLO|nr:hypothetical protein HYH03_002675 [Edaphochlamys debaryana]|eukprot:KAG2499742.1 hypothetical protein HYH03_002675 [Edaphochlamys debaryana]
MQPARQPVVESLPLPASVPAPAILGQKGKLVLRLSQLTQTKVSYFGDDHRLDITGKPSDVRAAAHLVEKTVEHYQYSGLQFARKQTFSVLSPELAEAPALDLIPFSRPVAGSAGPAFLISAPDRDPDMDEGGAQSLSASRQQPGASTSAPYETREGGRRSIQIIQDSDQFEPCLQSLLDLAVTAALRHPADCSSAEVRVYLGKLALVDTASSARRLPPAELLTWRFPGNARGVFETSLPHDTIRSLDSYLSGAGLQRRKHVRTASLHLETSIPWIQYHPTFTADPDGSGRLCLSKLEALGCKPLSLALLGPAGAPDARLRFVASVEHPEDDPVAAELRARAAAGEFALVNGNREVVVPNDLKAMDLTLTSARVKLKQVYVTPEPLPPPVVPPYLLGPATSAAASPAAAAAPRRITRARRATSSPAAALPAVSLKVTAAAVVDNLGGRRLEVTAACPEVNALLMQLHRERAEPPGARQELEARVRSFLAHLHVLRQNVAFTP